MSTKTRLGIDITAVDKTKAAFASVDRSMGSLSKSVGQIKQLLFLEKLTPFLENGIRSLIDIAQQSAPVKTAMDNLTLAWTGFAQKVGDAGLNAALINFANRLGAMLLGADGLSASIGKFMGGAVNLMATVFEGIGRAIAFAYDNAQIFMRFIAAMALVAFAQRVLSVGMAFYFFAKSVRTTGLIMTAFQSISRANLLVFLALAAGVAYATDSLDQLRAGIDGLWSKVKQVFPEIASGVSSAMEGLGFDMSALSGDMANMEQYLRRLKGVSVPAAEGMAKLGKTTGATTKTVKDAKTPMEHLTRQAELMTTALNQAAESVGGKMGEFFSGVIDGSIKGANSIKKFVGEALRDLAKLTIKNAFTGLAGLFAGGAPSQQGLGFSLLGSLLTGFAGAFAAGGSIPAGQWGIVGEGGRPEIVAGPATVFPTADAVRGGAGAQQVHVMVTLSDDLRAEVDSKVQSGMRQAVQVSVAESGRQAKASFPSAFREARVRSL